jgi:phosphoribosylanthranilate isomerase
MSITEAELAIHAGASAIGLVSQMPSGPGIIPDELITQIAAHVGAAAETVLLTQRSEATSIIAQHQLCRTTTLQFVNHVPFDELVKVRQTLPSVTLIQVIHVMNEQSITEAIAAAPFVDALILDSGNPNADVRQLGGTGRVHNWTLSRSIVSAVAIPVLLAGGISCDNVAQAIDQVKPFGVDLCSNVRKNNQLDSSCLLQFFAACA